MRKIIASVAVIMCITTPTYAMNFCDSGWNYLEGQNAFIHKAGLDQENLDKKTFQKTGYLHAQIKQLQAENEQLRNSISLMRSGKIALGVSEHDPRILGLIDENKRLSAQLGQERVQSSFIDQYVQQITTLKYENQKLSRKVGELIITSAMGGNSSGGDTTQILLLRQQIKTLQEENRDASTALAKITQKALASDKFADKANNAYENNLKAVELLKQRLSKAQEENKGLQAKLDFAYKDAVSNDDFGVLRQQNESLRATIQAQNELLRSTDNAAKTAERLLTENTMLQHKLQLVEKFGNANNRNTKEMAERVKVLEKDVVQRDTYIKKMIAAKSAELAAMSKSNTPNIVGETASLRENNDALVKALDKEKENNIAYRRKIVEYQAELAQRKEVEQASSSGVHRASIFERHIKALEQKQQQAENRSSELKLENQELKARMELLSASIKDNLFDDIQPASGHSFIKDNNKGYSSIKEAPPVLDSKDTQDLSKDEEESSIKGVLKEHSAANEVSADNGRLAVNDNFLDAEVLLATGLLPLQ